MKGIGILRFLILIALCFVSENSAQGFRGGEQSYGINVEANAVGTNLQYQLPQASVKSSSPNDWQVENDNAQMVTAVNSPVAANVFTTNPKFNVLGQWPAYTAQFDTPKDVTVGAKRSKLPRKETTLSRKNSSKKKQLSAPKKELKKKDHSSKKDDSRGVKFSSPNELRVKNDNPQMVDAFYSPAATVHQTHYKFHVPAQFPGYSIKFDTPQDMISTVRVGAKKSEQPRKKNTLKRKNLSKKKDISAPKKEVKKQDHPSKNEDSHGNKFASKHADSSSKSQLKKEVTKKQVVTMKKEHQPLMRKVTQLKDVLHRMQEMLSRSTASSRKLNAPLKHDAPKIEKSTVTEQKLPAKGEDILISGSGSGGASGSGGKVLDENANDRDEIDRIVIEVSGESSGQDDLDISGEEGSAQLSGDDVEEDGGVSGESSKKDTVGQVSGEGSGGNESTESSAEISGEASSKEVNEDIPESDDKGAIRFFTGAKLLKEINRKIHSKQVKESENEVTGNAKSEVEKPETAEKKNDQMSGLSLGNIMGAIKEIRHLDLHNPSTGQTLKDVVSHAKDVVQEAKMVWRDVADVVNGVRNLVRAKYTQELKEKKEKDKAVKKPLTLPDDGLTLEQKALKAREDAQTAARQARFAADKAQAASKVARKFADKASKAAKVTEMSGSSRSVVSSKTEAKVSKEGSKKVVKQQKNDKKTATKQAQKKVKEIKLVVKVKDTKPAPRAKAPIQKVNEETGKKSANQVIKIVQDKVKVQDVKAALSEEKKEKVNNGKKSADTTTITQIHKLKPVHADNAKTVGKKSADKKKIADVVKIHDVKLAPTEEKITKNKIEEKKNIQGAVKIHDAKQTPTETKINKIQKGKKSADTNVKKVPDIVKIQELKPAHIEKDLKNVKNEGSKFADTKKIPVVVKIRDAKPAPSEEKITKVEKKKESAEKKKIQDPTKNQYAKERKIEKENPGKHISNKKTHLTEKVKFHSNMSDDKDIIPKPFHHEKVGKYVGKDTPQEDAVEVATQAAQVASTEALYAKEMENLVIEKVKKLRELQSKMKQTHEDKKLTTSENKNIEHSEDTDQVVEHSESKTDKTMSKMEITKPEDVGSGSGVLMFPDSDLGSGSADSFPELPDLESSGDESGSTVSGEYDLAVELDPEKLEAARSNSGQIQADAIKIEDFARKGKSDSRLKPSAMRQILTAIKRVQGLLGFSIEKKVKTKSKLISK